MGSPFPAPSNDHCPGRRPVLPGRSGQCRRPRWGGVVAAEMTQGHVPQVWRGIDLLCAEMRQTLFPKPGSATFRFVKWRKCARPFFLCRGCVTGTAAERGCRAPTHVGGRCRLRSPCLPARRERCRRPGGGCCCCR